MLVLQTIHAKMEENVSPLTMALFVIVVKLISVEFSANKVSENYNHTLNSIIDDDLLTYLIFHEFISYYLKSSDSKSLFNIFLTCPWDFHFELF